jgi:hypothetical protein
MSCASIDGRIIRWHLYKAVFVWIATFGKIQEAGFFLENKEFLFEGEMALFFLLTIIFQGELGNIFHDS